MLCCDNNYEIYLVIEKFDLFLKYKIFILTDFKRNLD